MTTEQERQPTLIVVTGQPGAGKTTLAHSLARAIRCPALCRDELKEGLIHTTGIYGKPADDLGRQVYDVFFDTIALLLRQQVTLVAEAAFQHKLWAPKLESLLPVARVRVVVCWVEPELARVRQVARAQSDSARASFHPSAVVEAVQEGRVLPVTHYDPPHLDVPKLIVNTTEGYLPDLASIVAFAS